MERAVTMPMIALLRVNQMRDREIVKEREARKRETMSLRRMAFSSTQVKDSHLTEREENETSLHKIMDVHNHNYNKHSTHVTN